MVCLVVTNHIPVGGNYHYFHTVDLLEFECLVSAVPFIPEFVVQPEVTLEGNGGQGLVLMLDPITSSFASTAW